MLVGKQHRGAMTSTTNPLTRRKPAALTLLMIWFGLSQAFVLTQPALGQTFNVLYQFTGGADGGFPVGNLLLYDAKLYGLGQNGMGSRGVAFQVDIPSSQETVLYSFAAGDDYYLAGGLLRDPAGNLYGLSTTGGNDSNDGVIFQITPAGALNWLYSFNGSDGYYPIAGMVRGPAGSLYGTTPNGPGPTGLGLVFELSAAGDFRILHAFAGMPDGQAPGATPILYQGFLYGTTLAGGTYTNEKVSGFGTVYVVNIQTGAERVIHSFSGGARGAQPTAGLVRGPEGNLYGTTSYGGGGTGPTGEGCGIIFAILASSHQMKILHTFSGPDGCVPGGLLLGSDGTLYGTTSRGGEDNFGTVFKLDRTQNLIMLHSFDGVTDGAYPPGGLVMDAAGSIFGATSENTYPATQTAGTIFVITP
jgi:uncharacterized repeat protein (TIGR03803 family)